MAIKSKNAKPFGYGLYIDLYNCNSEILDDLGRCYSFLEYLVMKLKMKKQSPPYIFRSPIEFPDKAGLSGWIPLIESGIQLHTLIPKKFASLDVYSCGKFDKEKIVKEAKKFFKSTKVEIQYLHRGVEYYKI